MAKTATTRAKRKPPSEAERKRAADEQVERFREFAREHEADEDPEAFDEKFRKIVPRKKPFLNRN